VQGFRSPVHGNWKRTPGGDVVFRMIGFALDEDGNLGAPALGGGGILRTTGILSFAGGMASGSADVEILLPEQDPLDASEAPIFTIPIEITARFIEL
jgi:hypothetical protein